MRGVGREEAVVRAWGREHWQQEQCEGQERERDALGQALPADSGSLTQTQRRHGPMREGEAHPTPP